MKQIRRIDWVVVVTALFFAVGCSGSCGGCDGMEPIPGGFPAAKRTANAAQIRVTPTAIAKITADPAGLIGPLLGNAAGGKINFDIPASCSDPKICCVNNVPSATCGPLEIDLNRVGNEAPRLEVAPQQGASTVKVTIRARINTVMDIPIAYSLLSCSNVGIHSGNGNIPDVTITADLAFTQDGTSGTTRIAMNNVNLANFENDDLDLGSCSFLNFARGTIIDLFKSQLTGQLSSAVNDQVCKTCTAVADCGSSFASACTDGVCKMQNGNCLQETGLAGRLKGAGLFGSFSPGTTGAIDLYEVLGGYAATDGNGISLGMLGGMQPAGAARDRCGPIGMEPAPVTIARNAQFDANARTDVAGNPPFDVAIGLSKNQLDQFAYAGYDGGLLCLTIGHQTVAQLTTDTLSLLSRSLSNLSGGNNAPMAVGLRPQSAPIITLGKNIFTDDGAGGSTLTEPLLDIKFNAMEIDFFASVDEQWIRVFTVVSDVHLPIGLQTSGMGQLVPVIGNTDEAFTNLSVKNSEAVTETPADLANLFPALLSVVLPQLSNGLGGFDLPALGPLAIQPTAITSIDNNNFLAIFANLTTAMAHTAPIETHATITDIVEAAPETIRDPAKWTKQGTPAVTLDLGTEPGLEYSIRIDSGSWSPWSKNSKPRLAPRAFWIPARHIIEVRARKIDDPSSLDATPERLEVTLGDSLLNPTKPIAFHGQGSAGGCDCNSSGSGSTAGLFALVMLGIILPVRRSSRRAMKKLGPVVWATVLACLPGCSCGSDNPCGDVECKDGEQANGGLGRFTSIAADDKRVLVATYDNGLGDLVVGDATDPAKINLLVVDGVPDGQPIYDPKTYRGGIMEPGADVGMWTSIALSDHKAHVAYYDKDNKALRYAREDSPGKWRTMEIDSGDGDVGLYTSITIDSNGNPAISYLATGIDDGAGHFTSELRVARAATKTPGAGTDFTITNVVTGVGTCAGMCSAGTACLPATETDPETCKPTGTCTAACGDDQACIDNACVDIVPDPSATDIASGTGLYSSIALMSDGRLAVTYYDRAHHSLAVSVEGSSGGNDYAETVLDAAGDRGMWSSAVADGSGTLHVAYQDALGDQLMYTTFNGAPGTPEVADDGQRAGDRTHSVGASASIYLVNGTPTIAYQDGLSSDVYVASKGGSWTTNDVASGALIDGISVAGCVGPGGSQFLAWDSMDPATTPIHHLVVKKN